MREDQISLPSYRPAEFTKERTPMTPLREQLLTDMRAQNLPKKIQDRYILEVATLAQRTRKSPDLVAPDELAEFLKRRSKELPATESALAAEGLKFFFSQTLGQIWRPTETKRSSELRQRMVQDMRLRNLSPKTQEEYLRWTTKFSEFYGKSPAKLEPEDIRSWLVHLVEKEHKSISTYRVAAAALRFLYVQTLGRPWVLRYIPLPKREKRLPDVLSQQETLEFLGAELTLKETTVLSTTYAGGLRTTEVCRLKVTDIDSGRMVLKIVQGKGRKDRYVALSKKLLESLRKYWKEHRPSTWLFPNANGSGPMSADELRRICNRAAAAAGLRKKVTPRTLRHCFATHQLERGYSLSKIQLAMGHRSIRSTSVYTHVAISSVCAMESPLDWLPKLPD